MIEKNTCDLDRLIEEIYGREINIAYIMCGERLTKWNVEPSSKEDKELAVKFVAGAEPNEEVIQALLNGLCSKRHLKRGEYLLEFDD